MPGPNAPPVSTSVTLGACCARSCSEVWPRCSIIVGVDRGDGQRRVLQVLLPKLRGHDDFLEAYCRPAPIGRSGLIAACAGPAIERPRA